MVKDIQAFPRAGFSGEGGYGRPELGMTLRDYFAAKAIPAVYETAMKEASEGSGLLQYDDWKYGLALDAYALADAMMKARDVPTK